MDFPRTPAGTASCSADAALRVTLMGAVIDVDLLTGSEPTERCWALEGLSLSLVRRAGLAAFGHKPHRCSTATMAYLSCNGLGRMRRARTGGAIPLTSATAAGWFQPFTG